MPEQSLIEITVLSVKQPWADWLMLDKWCENRSWMTKYRGRLYIHASSPQPKPDDPDCERFWDDLPFGGQIGVILGSVELVECAEAQDVEECYWKLAGRSQRKLTPRQQSLLEFLPSGKGLGKKGRHLWDYWMDQNAWICRDPKRLAVPIPAKGKLQLWKHQVQADALTTID